jgi:hypothetical protein
MPMSSSASSGPQHLDIALSDKTTGLADDYL